MESLSLNQLLAATGGCLFGDVSPDLCVNTVITDSRQIEQDCLFLPLIGEHFDAHDFIPNALVAGAAGCFTARDVNEPISGKFYIRVSDTRRALQDLAAWYRRQFSISVVAVTGSVGKTTTKDMLASVLGQHYHVLKTDGNFNNELGLPLTLLRLDRSHQIAVLEMGMSDFGEISELTRIAHPDVAVITNIGDAHMEYLGSREGILRAKSEIFEGMSTKSLAVLNGDDVLLRTLSEKLSMPIIWCGTGDKCDWRCNELKKDGQDHIMCLLHGPNAAWQQQIPGLGTYLCYPAAISAAVGWYFGLTEEEIAHGISTYIPTKMRMNILHLADGITILDDTYNANPQSVHAALEVLSGQSGRRIAVLGDMLELGSHSLALHEEAGRFLANQNIDSLITVGELGAHIADGAAQAGMTCLHRCTDLSSALSALETELESGCTVLCKASRGMHFERLVEKLTVRTPEKRQ